MTASPPRRRGQRRVVEWPHGIADDLALLMPLAGDDENIAHTEAANAAAMASALSPISVAPGAPASTRRIFAAFSLRGLSSVTITRSASRAAISP